CIWDFSPMRLGAAKRRGNRINRRMNVARAKDCLRWDYGAHGVTRPTSSRTRGFITRQGASRNNLRGPMENARVERRQFHSMSFGQFGKVQIGKLSARFRGDSLR